MQSKYYKFLIPTVMLLVSITMLFTFTGLAKPASVENSDNVDALDATSGYYILLTLKGQKQGAIKGDSKVQTDAIDVLGFSHSIVSPRDAASGLPTGKRQHKPLTITKEIDKSTPLLFNVLTTNENLPEFKLEFYRPSPTGATEMYYTIELVNANIASISSFQSSSSSLPREHISFVYEKIIWTWTEGGITVEDDWASPNV